MATITLSIQETEEYFCNALCNGLGIVSDYGLELIYKSEEYNAAKSALQNAKPGNAVCYEDILMQILKDGGTLTLNDLGGEEAAATITLKDVHERMNTIPMNHLMEMINEEDDAETADVIIQTVFLCDVVYG